jgi:asparagine synthase (glutamine-hydrolysing)
MCGLTGIFSVDRDSSRDELIATARRMADALHHRGPDDAGAWADPLAGIALGFRRLAIVDLTPQGHQPMESASGRYVVAFNGEIYNFEELRAELDGGQPQVYRGRSDTEVMLAAFERWGVIEAVQRLIGMFAFALWDRHERTLHLARDRFGEKPLYYGWVGRHFLFGSELKALTAFGRGALEIDREALGLFLRYGYIPAPHSIYRGIRKLTPGTVLTLRAPAAGDLPSPRAYWSARETDNACAADPFTGSDAEALHELDTLLRDVVARQMVADVPLGAFLSGGTDSSLIVSIMQSLSSRAVKTFTIGFREDAFNEAEHARRVAHHLKTDHTELYVSADVAMNVIPALPRLFDEPFADPSQIPTHLVAALARRHVTVSLSGDGGDELFAGYGWYRQARQIWSTLAWLPRPIRRAAGAVVRTIPPGGWDALLSPARVMLPRQVAQAVCGDKVHKVASVIATANSAGEVHDSLMTRWNGDSPLIDAPPTAHVGLAIQPLHARRHPIEQLMYRDVMTYLPDDILAKVDRASMAVSLESRAPLLDHRVYELACRLPFTMKVRDGRGKWLLRELLYRYVPRELVDRPKMGFCVPIATWLRDPLREWAADLLDERQVRHQGLFDPKPIAVKWREHLTGRRNWAHHLWNVLMFQAWIASHA